MGRTAHKKPDTAVIAGQAETVAPEAVQAHLQVHDEMRVQLQVIDAQYGGGEFEITTYNRERVLNECKFFLGQSAQAMLEAGKRLILMKEHEPHGDWIGCLERLNIEPRVAQMMMKATLKFDTPNTKTFSHLPKSKLFELMALDDDEINELAEGGTVAGLTQDDIDRMSTRELRAALRESKEDITAKKASLATRDERINALEEKLHRQKKPTPARQEEKALTELNDQTLLVVREIEVGLLAQVSELARLTGAESTAELPEKLKPAIRAALMQIAQATRLLAADVGVSLTQLDETPDAMAWLPEAEAMFGEKGGA